MALTFLDAVNRILRTQGFIRGDTDPLVSFTDTNHNATSSIAQIAVQNEIQAMMAEGDLAYERATGTINIVTGTRTYALASDFISFWGDPAFIYDATQNLQIFEYPGGEDQLRDDVLTYLTDSGSIMNFYFVQTTVKTVGFFNVPNASLNGRVLSYEYEKTVTPSLSTDPMPFQNNDEVYAFCDAAARRFKYLYEGKNDALVESDPVWRSAMTRLLLLMKGKSPSRHYGRTYV